MGSDADKYVLTISNRASTMAASNTWKQRWCVLGDGALQYFEKVVDQTPRGLVPIEDMTSVKAVREDVKVLGRLGRGLGD